MGECVADRTALPLEALEFLFDCDVASGGAGAAGVRARVVSAGRPLLEAVARSDRAAIHDEFTFDTEATTVTTPLAEVFESRRGVCQDFTRSRSPACDRSGARACMSAAISRPRRLRADAAAESAPMRRTRG